MDNEWKTPAELNVQPGDVVQGRETLRKYKVTQYMCIGSIRVEDCRGLYRIVSRATPKMWRDEPAAETPKLWRDMTREEKGALLLAAHEGKVIEYEAHGWRATAANDPGWFDDTAYRVRPEPKPETLVLFGGSDLRWAFNTRLMPRDTHRLTLPLLDGDLAPGKYTSPEGHTIEVERING